MFTAQKPQARVATALMAGALTMLSACGDDAVDCGVGQSRQLEGARYCLYPERELGEDFKCPTGMSKNEVKGGVVCAPQERAGELPGALQAPFGAPMMSLIYCFKGVAASTSHCRRLTQLRMVRSSLVRRE